MEPENQNTKSQVRLLHLQDTELWCRLVFSYLCGVGGRQGFMELRGFIGWTGGSLESPRCPQVAALREKRTDEKTVTRRSFATICHHYSPHCVHKDRAPSHSEPLTLICERARAGRAHQTASLSLTAVTLIPLRGGGWVLGAKFSVLISKGI